MGVPEAGNLRVALPYPSLPPLNTGAELGVGGCRLVPGPGPPGRLGYCGGPGAGRPRSRCPGVSWARLEYRALPHWRGSGVTIRRGSWTWAGDAQPEPTLGAGKWERDSLGNPSFP